MIIIIIIMKLEQKIKEYKRLIDNIWYLLLLFIE